ncbi:MAG TPA: caspase family protein [Polyangium sp.]|nr:caspase family protein [Polyangium sp.]
MKRNYALLIGIHDYTHYDPSGASNVLGARNDVKAWYRTCLALGIPAENIRVLASPILCNGIAQATIAEATREKIIEHLGWLAKQIGGDEPASGLITFSGHADAGEDGSPLVCPSDLTPSFEEIIDVGVLLKDAPPHVKKNLTMMLDTCHAQQGATATAALVQHLAVRRSTMAVRGGDRATTMAACRRNQESVSAVFSGHRLGAFTWAATSALTQWTTQSADGVTYVDVSYSDLLERVRGLLSTLSFSQIPVLSGPPGIEKQAFLYSNTDRGTGATHSDPTAFRGARQLDGGENCGFYRKYQINFKYLERGVPYMKSLCSMYVTSAKTGCTYPAINGRTMVPNTEYWVFDKDTLALVSTKYTDSGIEMVVDAESNSNITVDTSSYSIYTANASVASWMPVGNSSAPSNSFGWGQAAGISRTLQAGILVMTSSTSNVPKSWQWIQTGSQNLSPEQLINVVLWQASMVGSLASDNYAPSTFTAF